MADIGNPRSPVPPHTHRASGEADWTDGPSTPLDRKTAQLEANRTLRHQYMCAVLQGLLANPSIITPKVWDHISSQIPPHLAGLGRDRLLTETSLRLNQFASIIADDAIKNGPGGQ